MSDVVRRNIAAEAARQGIRQTDLAAAFGLSRGPMSERFRGVTAWTLDDVERAADVLGVPLAVLLLPRLDSNQQPSGYAFAQASGSGVAVCRHCGLPLAGHDWTCTGSDVDAAWGLAA